MKNVVYTHVNGESSKDHKSWYYYSAAYWHL